MSFLIDAPCLKLYPLGTWDRLPLHVAYVEIGLWHAQIERTQMQSICAHNPPPLGKLVAVFSWFEDGAVTDLLVSLVWAIRKGRRRRRWVGWGGGEGGHSWFPARLIGKSLLLICPTEAMLSAASRVSGDWHISLAQGGWGWNWKNETRRAELVCCQACSRFAFVEISSKNVDASNEAIWLNNHNSSTKAVPSLNAQKFGTWKDSTGVKTLSIIHGTFNP